MEEKALEKRMFKLVVSIRMNRSRDDNSLVEPEIMKRSSQST